MIKRLLNRLEAALVDRLVNRLEDRLRPRRRKGRIARVYVDGLDPNNPRHIQVAQDAMRKWASSKSRPRRGPDEEPPSDIPVGRR